MSCLFCKIIQGEVPANIAYRDEHLIAFHDIQPQAPHHLLVVPTLHIETLNAVEEENIELVGRLLYTAKQLAQRLHIAEEGYRMVMNCNKGAGQSVFHIHVHLLGGRIMGWPPG